MEVLYRFLRLYRPAFPLDWAVWHSQLKHCNHCDVAPFILRATFFAIQCLNTTFSAVQMKRKNRAEHAKHQGLYLVTLCPDLASLFKHNLQRD